MREIFVRLFRVQLKVERVEGGRTHVSVATYLDGELAEKPRFAILDEGDTLTYSYGKAEPGASLDTQVH